MIDFSDTILLQNKIMFMLQIDFNDKEDLYLLDEIIQELKQKPTIGI